ncbi:FlgD immunoglobulin-like domain containing protein [candidate division KSB1 bacterium]
MNKLKNSLVFAGAALLLLFPKFSKAQEINPFIQPIQTTIYYGSGDVDSSGAVDQTDYNLIQSGVSNDLSDIDGDGTPSTQADLDVLENYLSGQTLYLPSDWNKLTTRQERESWVDKMYAIDKTDTSTATDSWTCNEYSVQTYININGFNGTIPSKYDTTNNARFNLPFYVIGIRHPGHAASAILMGDNALNWNDWYFIEPQNDKEVKIGAWNLELNSEVWIEKVNEIWNYTYVSERFIKFKIENGIPSLLSYEPNVITQRPTSAIGDEEEKGIIPEQFYLNQNYPNPFNPETTLKFYASKTENVELTIYNSNGVKVKTIFSGYVGQGDHHYKWDGTNESGMQVSSGIYLYQLKASDFQEVKRMMFVK